MCAPGAGNVPVPAVADTDPSEVRYAGIARDQLSVALRGGTLGARGREVQRRVRCAANIPDPSQVRAGKLRRVDRRTGTSPGV